MNVTVGDGKYTVRQNPDGRLVALRYGEPWRDCCGDGLIFTLAAEVEKLREVLQRIRDTPDTSEPFCGEEADKLRRMAADAFQP